MAVVKFVAFLLIGAGCCDGRDIFEFSRQDHNEILRDAYGEGENDTATGRSSFSSGRREKLTSLLLHSLETQGYLPVRLFSRAASIGVVLDSTAHPLVPVRGPTSNCHFSPPCLDLACGKCYDPMTSLHSECGSMSYFKCSSLLPPECLPWTCATGSGPTTGFLRNFLPRSAGCGNPNLQLVSSKNLPNGVELTGLGLSTNSLTSCSELTVCWDPSCSLCYDPLEQYHSPCPAHISVSNCSTSLPDPCQPVICWHKNENETVQTTSVVLRDFPSKDVSDIVCRHQEV